MKEGEIVLIYDVVDYTRVLDGPMGSDHAPSRPVRCALCVTGAPQGSGLGCSAAIGRDCFLCDWRVVMAYFNVWSTIFNLKLSIQNSNCK